MSTLLRSIQPRPTWSETIGDAATQAYHACADARRNGNDFTRVDISTDRILATLPIIGTVNATVLAY